MKFQGKTKAFKRRALKRALKQNRAELRRVKRHLSDTKARIAHLQHVKDGLKQWVEAQKLFKE